MKYTIDIDTGGTFTDGFFTKGGKIERVKVDTTPHDFTVCFMKCIEEGAHRFGISLEELLKNAEVVRLSTTVGSNILITKSGPKIGLIVTGGYENNLYGNETDSDGVFDFLILPNMVIGIQEEIDSSGQPLKPPQEDELRAAVRKLLEMGARIIVISLANAGINSAHEKIVKDAVIEDYPTHYLGGVPVLLSTEVSPSQDDSLRTNTTIVNAYLHKEMARFLYRADEALWRATYQKPLLVTHSRGGAARVAKTIAIQTLDSGPACGVVGTAFMCKLYGMENVASIDIGGTSTDVGLVIRGSHNLEHISYQGGLQVSLPRIAVKSIGGGGGSIAMPVIDSNRVQMGPESAGALPGPACYDLGGIDATATDACVALGYIDPDYFLGGRRRLNKARAWETIKDNVAKPLGLGVEEAACMMVEGIESIGAEGVAGLISQHAMAPRDFILFPFGGAGGLFCHGVAARLGISKVFCFPISPVFCAFGSSTLDILHHYESAKKVSLYSRSLGYLDQVDTFNSVVKELQHRALRDMRGEGFDPEKVSFSLELALTGSSGAIVVESPRDFLKDMKDVEGLCEIYGRAAGDGQSDIEINHFHLLASSPILHHPFLSYEDTGKNPEKAYKGERQAYWDGRFRQTRVYERGILQCGNIVEGPAIIESSDTVVRLPPDARFTVDRFLSGVMELT